MSRGVLQAMTGFILTMVLAIVISAAVIVITTYILHKLKLGPFK